MGTFSETATHPQDHQALAWYRYGWPWFLISIPLISMGLGAMMLYLGLSTNNSMVVDDYYKEGKAINQRIERDRTTSLLGLSASLYEQDANLIVDLTRHEVALPETLTEQATQADAIFVWPDQLALRWVHVTQAARDGQAALRSIGGNRFIAVSASLPDDGNYRLHLQPPGTAHWRLVSDVMNPAETTTVTFSAPAPNQVFNKRALE